MEYGLAFKLAKALLEEAEIDLHSGEDCEDCNVASLAKALICFLDTLPVLHLEQISYAIGRFEHRPSPADLLSWQGVHIQGYSTIAE